MRKYSVISFNITPKINEIPIWNNPIIREIFKGYYYSNWFIDEVEEHKIAVINFYINGYVLSSNYNLEYPTSFYN